MHNKFSQKTAVSEFSFLRTFSCENFAKWTFDGNHVLCSMNKRIINSSTGPKQLAPMSA